MRKAFWVIGVAGVLSLLFSCSTLRTAKGDAHDRLPQPLRNKFDYFYMEAERMKAQDKDDAAFDLMTRALETDTANISAKFFLASYLLGDGQFEKAYAYLRDAAEGDPDNYWFNVAYANVSLQAERADEAIRVWKRLVAKNPQKPELNSALADAYLQKGEIDSAINCYSQMELSMGMMDAITVEKMKLYRMKNDTAGLVTEAERLQQAYPQNADYMRLLGDVYLQVNRDSAAMSMYRQAEAQEPDNGRLYLSRASYYEKQGDTLAYNNEIRGALLNMGIDVDTKLQIFTSYIIDELKRGKASDRIESLFREMLELYPQEEPVHRLYGSYLSTIQKYVQAEEQFAMATDLEPTSTENWLRLLELLMFEKKYESLIDYGLKAVEYIPSEKDLYVYMGIAYSQLKRNEEAITLMRNVIASADADDPGKMSELYMLLGDFCNAAGQWEEAVEAYKTSLRFNPLNVGTMNNYAYLLAVRNTDLDYAERMSAKSLKEEPDNVNFLDTYAWVLFRQKSYSLAKWYLEKALENAKEPSAELFEHYGDVLSLLGETDRAVEYWQRAIQTGGNTDLLLLKIEWRKYIEE